MDWDAFAAWERKLHEDQPLQRGSRLIAVPIYLAGSCLLECTCPNAPPKSTFDLEPKLVSS